MLLPQLPLRPVIGMLFLCSSIACGTSVCSTSAAGEPSLEYAPLSADLVAVPQNLLALSHTPEVQKDLKLDTKELAQWEAALRDIDKIWWPARLLPPTQQRKIIAELETKLVTGLERIQGKSAVLRLRQIELQSQSARVLVRPEVAKYLRLDATQNNKLSELFAETDELGKDLAANDEKKLQQLTTAKQAEPKNALAILKPEQAERLRKSYGEPLDTTKVERIYPFAPELIEAPDWVGAPTTLASMRGKVVVIHFYAFQCHNCVANFKHYKRWDETLKSRGVEVIGIQRPETSAERDPDLVVEAAKKEGFEFPVLIDLEDKNWNAWGNTMWPTVYIVDKKGYIRFWWQGELNWQGATTDKKVEAIIEQLLKEEV
jgi:peroxiredoxin